jgi:hypothetical protein
MGLHDLLEDGVGEEGTRREMLAWYDERRPEE